MQFLNTEADSRLEMDVDLAIVVPKSWETSWYDVICIQTNRSLKQHPILSRKS